MTKYRYAVLYGFQISNPNNTGYIHVTKHGAEVVSEQDDATEFPFRNYSHVKGYGNPYNWCDFFNTEDYLSDWKFHVVKLVRDKK